MTQKLTLPLEVGKKYIRRDGKVVTVREPFPGKVASWVYVGEENTAEKDTDGHLHAWKNSGVIYTKQSQHQHDIVADYIETAAHPYAEAMMEYAKDAATMAEPWKNWEIRYNKRNDTDWRNCVDHPAWNTEYQYRRKQPKVVINGIECVAGVKEPVFDELYCVASITQRDYHWSVRYTGAHKSYADRGLLHRTKEDAIAMAKAMLNFQ